MKYRNRIKFKYFIVILLFVSCNDSSVYQNIIDPKVELSKSNLIENIDKLEYFILPSDKILIDDELNKIIFTDSVLFILTYNRSKIFTYNFVEKKSIELSYNADIPKRIGEAGDILDMSFDKLNGHLFVSDIDQNIFVIDTKNYLVIKLLRKFAYNMFSLKGNLLINNYDGNQLIYNINWEDNSIRSSYLNFNTIANPIIGAYAFAHANNESCYYLENSSDTIYQINLDDSWPRFTIGKENTSFRSIENSEKYINNLNFYPELKPNDGILLPKTPIYTINNLLLVNLVNDDRQIWHDIISGENCFIKRSKHKYFKLIFPYSHPTCINNYGEYVLSYTYVDKDFRSLAKEYIREGENKYLKDNLNLFLEKLENVDHEENPVITKITFRKNVKWF